MISGAPVEPAEDSRLGKGQLFCENRLKKVQKCRNQLFCKGARKLSRSERQNTHFKVSEYRVATKQSAVVHRPRAQPEWRTRGAHFRKIAALLAKSSAKTGTPFVTEDRRLPAAPAPHAGSCEVRGNAACAAPPLQ